MRTAGPPKKARGAARAAASVVAGVDELAAEASPADLSPVAETPRPAPPERQVARARGPKKRAAVPRLAGGSTGAIAAPDHAAVIHSPEPYQPKIEPLFSNEGIVRWSLANRRSWRARRREQFIGAIMAVEAARATFRHDAGPPAVVQDGSDGFAEHRDSGRKRRLLPFGLLVGGSFVAVASIIAVSVLVGAGPSAAHDPISAANLTSPSPSPTGALGSSVAASPGLSGQPETPAPGVVVVNEPHSTEASALPHGRAIADCSGAYTSTDRGRQAHQNAEPDAGSDAGPATPVPHPLRPAPVRSS